MPGSHPAQLRVPNSYPRRRKATRSSWCGRLVFLLLLWLTGCHSQSPAPLTRFEFTQPQMGMPFRLVLYAPDKVTAGQAATAAFSRVKQLNDSLSDYDPDSELSRLSQSSGKGIDVPVGKDLWLVLWRAQALAAQTDGAFDVTVGPIVNLWRKARREQQLPRRDLLAEARTRVGWRNLRLDSRRHTARLLVPDMRLDLGAIAKGYAVDEALRILRRNGLHRSLVNCGGDMAMGEPPPGHRGWRIEIATLDAPDAPPARYVSLANAALATSGDAFQRLELDGRRYSHIVDLHTGIGLTDHSLVHVIARDCMTADSLATAISVLGPERGLALLKTKRSAAARIARQPGKNVEVIESPGFPQFYSSENR